MTDVQKARFAPLIVSLSLAACASAPKAEPVDNGHRAPPAPVVQPAVPAPPQGPTRTSFKAIAKKLTQRCIGGGWISSWRSEHEDVDVARPKVYLEPVEDRTEMNLDPTYLKQTLAHRMQLSRVFEIVADAKDADFIGKPSLLRLAEEGRHGRISVYTATLQLKNAATQDVVHSCEASVRGEL